MVSWEAVALELLGSQACSQRSLFAPLQTRSHVCGLVIVANAINAVCIREITTVPEAMTGTLLLRGSSLIGEYPCGPQRASIHQTYVVITSLLVMVVGAFLPQI